MENILGCVNCLNFVLTCLLSPEMVCPRGGVLFEGDERSVIIFFLGEVEDGSQWFGSEYGHRCVLFRYSVYRYMFFGNIT